MLWRGNKQVFKGQLWVYARDDRPWSGTSPPAATYAYASDRRNERPIEHLEGFSDVLQVDGYAGYNWLGATGGVTLAFFWAHHERA